jgi:hypothetical protein
MERAWAHYRREGRGAVRAEAPGLAFGVELAAAFLVVGPPGARLAGLALVVGSGVGADASAAAGAAVFGGAVAGAFGAAVEAEAGGDAFLLELAVGHAGVS